MTKRSYNIKQSNKLKIKYYLAGCLIIYMYAFCLNNELFASEVPPGYQTIVNADSLHETMDTTGFYKKYRELIRKGDIAYKYKRYLRARNFYEEALTYKPAGTYPKERINKINKRFRPIDILFFRNLDFERPTTLILVLIIVIIYSVITMLVLLIVILLNRNKMERLDRINEGLREKYQEALLDYLYDEENRESIIKRIQNIAGTYYNRQFLIDEMIDLSINLKGEPANKLQQLFYALNLKNVSIRKAKSRRWHVKVKGFKELAFMNIRDANDEIIRALDSRNDILRMEAQIALVRLTDKEPYTFLDYMEKPFTLWEQMNIHEVIMYHDLPIPQFERWIHSRNKSVAIFAINMIQVFKQKESYKKVVGLLMNEDPEIRYYAIRTLGVLKIKDTISDLKYHFSKETYENKLAVLEAFQRITDTGNIEFLKWVLENEDDVFIQIAAAKGIRNIGEEGTHELENLVKSPEYRNYQIILRHVLDKRI